MTNTIFFHLLDGVNRPSRLSGAVEAVRENGKIADIYQADSSSFCQVPGSPFAYWATENMLSLFKTNPGLEDSGFNVRKGLDTNDDFRFFRLFWEVPVEDREYITLVKGGSFTKYYSDPHLVIDWTAKGRSLREFLYSRGDHPSRNIRSEDKYFRPGFTWSQRSQSGLSVRVLPKGCIFSTKGPGIVAEDQNGIMGVLAMLNSSAYSSLVHLQMAFGSYDIGVLKRTPLPYPATSGTTHLSKLAAACIELKRVLDTTNEISHIFHLPALLQARATALAEALADWQDRVFRGEQQLAENQREIDDIAFKLYGIEDEDRQAIEGPLSGKDSVAGSDEDDAGAETEDGQEAAVILDSGALTADVVSYAVGCVFGRWDARIALVPSLAPKLTDPFAPLPVCSPGTLVGPDGLPAKRDGIASEEWMRARLDAITPPPDGSVEKPIIPDSEYPLAVDWDGILVDEPEHSDDIVGRVREVLGLLWGRSADEIESEACDLLGVKDLHAYFRNPRKFFDFHTKRYSKSRRKAPIYWFLQSPKKNYGLWIYYHRLDPDLLFKALTNYVEPKIRLEESRLEEYEARRRSAGTGGSEAKKAEKAVDKQEDLLSDLREFRDRLARAANLHLDPDLNDGVVLNIAPLHELVPWTEAASKWKDLLAGKYEWSSIGKQLRAKCIVS